ncbi:hypothetical protein QRN89_14865 [Streptomyces chengbuensis]|uniref:hypothetical protein n=1 Tax=Streptomyces TaxID=1883 RepID=UPI0025B2F55B|nr:hypothetical protein [Streptomyces sp. HUAS CB01]WJY50976.1 hypothetical protein QRN89_14865 [Streptomyces sp. HUAS CB01]
MDDPTASRPSARAARPALAGDGRNSDTEPPARLRRTLGGLDQNPAAGLSTPS